jgi:N-acetylglucosaminyldiphosphoundecaprenol N-acetyl-beta-D-mannosaminyltransferase
LIDSEILGTRIDPTSLDHAVACMMEWACSGKTHYVCVANVHMVMEAYDSPDFQAVVNAADLVVSD